jgi:hypothetical protein
MPRSVISDRQPLQFVSVYYVLPPVCLQSDLNFFRALPCKPLAFA